MSWFGLGGKKPMMLTPFSEDKPRTFMSLLCDGYVATQVPSLAVLVRELRALQSAHPDHRVLATLDNREQAFYTSGHTVHANGLDDVEGHDLSGLDPQAFEAGEHRGYLSTQSEFPIRLANLLQLAADVTLRDLGGLLLWTDPDFASDLVTVNHQAEAALDLAGEGQVLIQLAPVKTSAEAVAALPNGYFSSDLDPMQNYVLAAHLKARFGLELFGIGASFLGFWRDGPLSAAEADDLAADLLPIYDEVPEGAADQLSAALRGKDVVLVRYTEA